MAERAPKTVPADAPGLDDIACVRAVLAGAEGQERIVAVAGPTEALLGKEARPGDRGADLFGEDSLRTVRWELRRSGQEGVCLALPMRGDERRWVEVRAEARGEHVLLLVTRASQEAEARRRTEVLHRYVVKLSDLALMFAFSETLHADSLVEVATEAVRRMSLAERASFYHVDVIAEDRLKAQLVHVANALRVGDDDLGGLPLDLGPDAAEVVVRLTRGTVIARRHEVWPVLEEAMVRRGTEVVIFVPVLRGDEVRGLLALEFAAIDRTLLLEEVRLLEAAMAMTGATLDRQQAGLELQRTLAFNESVVSAIADGIVVVDRQRRVTVANPSAQRILRGVLPRADDEQGDLGPADPLITLALDENGEPLPAAEHPIVRALSTGLTVGSATLGYGSARTGDETTWLEVSAQPITRAKGSDPDLVVVCFSDVTDRRRHEAELLLARDAALTASRLKGAFLANMSHEIRTPMNGIIGMASLLLECGLHPREREYAATLKGAAESLLGILDDVLDLSKIEAGRLTIERVEIDPVAVAEEVLDLLHHSAAAKGLDVILDIDPDLPHRVTGDPVRLKQILTNLVGNAIKFTPKGQVSVMASMLTRGDDVRLTMRVRDTGIGMTREETNRVFERFMQADPSTTRRFGGTGLGLSISHQLVELMGGRIGVDSATGVGSEFWFEVPTTVVAAGGAATDPLLEGKTVLVVVASDALRASLMGPLRRFGARPVDVADLDVAGGAVKVGAVDVAIVESGDDEGEAAIAGLGCRAPTVRLARDEDGPRDAVRLPVRLRALRRALVRAIAPVPDEEAASRTPAEGAQHYRVLVVEDQTVNQLVARSMLELLGCEVAVAEDGSEAVAMTAREAFDLVLMDVQMPEVDGFEATRLIRLREADEGVERPVPIVALSASAMETERDACLAAGMDGFLAKPVRLEDFKATFERFVRADGQAAPPLGAPPPGASPAGATPAVTPGPKSDDGAALVDDGTLRRLRRVNVEGESDIVLELVQLFFDEAGSRLRAMRTALDRGDARALRGHAHSLKGSASTLGVLAMAEHCKALEAAARDADLERAGALLGGVPAILEATRVEAMRVIPGARTALKPPAASGPPRPRAS